MKLDKQTVVFIIFHDLGIGGVQRKIADIVHLISTDKKYEDAKIYIVLDGKKPYDLEEDIFIDEIRKDKVTIFYRPQQRLWRFKFPLTPYVFWKILLLKPSTILSFMKRFSFIAIIMKYFFFWRKIRVVVSYDNVPSLLIPASYKKKARIILWKTIVRIFYPLADKVVVPSDEAAQDMINNFHVPSNRVKTNKNWVLRFTDRKGEKIKYDLIYTGRVDPVKNLSYFVEIVEEIKKIRPRVRACILGWGKEIDKIAKLINEKSLEENIELTGSQKDVSKYLLSSKIFLLTSDFEGLPISALEAMAHALPVIASDYPGATELVRDGKTGYICKSKEDYALKVLELLAKEGERKKMGRRAKEYVKYHHSKKNLENFVNLII